MDAKIRHMREDEWPLLQDFLYAAIFVPPGYEGEVPRSVIADDPLCRAAYQGFGERADDLALVAEVAGEVVGACWARTTEEYGHIDDETPSLSVSLQAPYRGRGIEGALLRRMLQELDAAGYARVSLSVQKENPALRLYERCGFRIIGDGADASEWLMVCRPHEALALEIRRMCLADIPAVSELRVAQLMEEGAEATCDLRPALQDHYARHLADGTFRAHLALEAGQILALGAVSIVEKPPYFGCTTGRIGLVSHMYTRPAYRRRGIARDLLLRVVDDARRAGCSVAQVTASRMGVSLYESVGFEGNPRFRQLAL